MNADSTTEVASLYKKAQYRLTTLVPLALKNVYIVDQEELDEFLEGYNEYAEFIVELISVKPDITKQQPKDD